MFNISVFDISPPYMRNVCCGSTTYWLLEFLSLSTCTSNLHGTYLFIYLFILFHPLKIGNSHIHTYILELEDNSRHALEKLQSLCWFLWLPSDRILLLLLLMFFCFHDPNESFMHHKHSNEHMPSKVYLYVLQACSASPSTMRPLINVA